MCKIMIVDDDGYICELVGTLLKNEGFLTCEAVNGRIALQRLEEEKPDLCIVDIMMSEMDGFELCKYIRQYNKDMPILRLTEKAEISQN